TKYLRTLTTQVNRYSRAKRRLIELLTEQKQAIIHQAVTRGLDPNVKLKPSGVEWLADIPEHWEVKPVKHWVKINSKSLPEDTDANFVFEYIDIGSVGRGVLTKPPEVMTFKQAPSHARRV